jgi:RHS repeat-associated protein
MTSRTWGSAAIAGTYLYDAAKRPVGLYIRLAGATSASVLARTYDVAGNVTSETQNLAGVGGGAGNATLAGSGTETFTYDAANRVVAAGFGAPGAQTETRAYTYDADSNRTSVTESGVTVYYFYDASDALVTKSLTNTNPNPGTSCTSLGFCYDAFGDLTSSSPSGPDASSADDLVVVHTNYSYDPAGHLTAITDGTSADAVSFTIDALGRHATQTIGSNPTSTYCYLGTSYSITTIANSAGTTYSTIDAIGDRLASGVGTTIGWIVPDLHGNVVAAIGPDATFVDALRFDPYGQTVATWTATTGSVKMPWRYQGRILESAGTGSSTDLYDFQARSYDPSLGGFTSIDSVSGSAQNPLTLNRYLYANANPATLVDPDGHCASEDHWSGCETEKSTKDFTDQIKRGAAQKRMATVRAAMAAKTAAFMRTAQRASDTFNTAVALTDAVQTAFAPNHHCDGLGCVGSFLDGFANGVVNMPGNTIRGIEALPSNPGAALEALSPMAPFHEAMTMAGQAQKGDWYSIGDTTGGKAASAALMVATLGAGEAVAALRGGSAAADVVDSSSAAARAMELQRQLPAGSSGRVTMGVGQGTDATGAVRTIVGTSEPGGYLRPGVLLQDGEDLAQGLGHAEKQIIDYMKAMGIQPSGVAAGRPMCSACVQIVEDAGAETWSSRR